MLCTVHSEKYSPSVNLNTKVLNDRGGKQPDTSSATALWKTCEDENQLEYGRLSLIFDYFIALWVVFCCYLQDIKPGLSFRKNISVSESSCINS